MTSRHMKRRYTVTRPFRATTRSADKNKSRIFQSGETVWWVDDYRSNPVTFESDFPFEWYAERNEFLAGVEFHGRQHSGGELVLAEANVLPSHP